MEETIGLPSYRWLARDYAVGPQPEAAHFTPLRTLGFRSILNIRPDGEMGLLMTAAEARALAERQGLAYGHLPVRGSLITAEHKVKAFEAIIDELPKPVFACCATGTRAAILWAFSAVRRLPANDALAACQRAGYDLSFFGEQLRERRRICAAGQGGFLRRLAGLWRQAG